MGRQIVSAALKTKAVLEALRGEKTLNEIASAYGVHPNLLGQWKKQAIEALPEVFAHRRDRSEADHEALTDRLYKRIGQLEVENDWLRKRPVSAIEARSGLIELGHPMISIARQCDLLGVNRLGIKLSFSTDSDCCRASICLLYSRKSSVSSPMSLCQN